jgi:hypothetical protein
MEKSQFYGNTTGEEVASICYPMDSTSVCAGSQSCANDGASWKQPWKDSAKLGEIPAEGLTVSA